MGDAGDLYPWSVTLFSREESEPENQLPEQRYIKNQRRMGTLCCKEHKTMCKTKGLSWLGHLNLPTH